MKKSNAADRIAPIVIGIILVLCSMIPLSSSLFGQTGYITEITRTERIGGREDIIGQPNTYKWIVAYKFKMNDGGIETGSVTVHGDAISSKSGLRIGSPVRYLAFYPGFNTPGEGGLDRTTFIWMGIIAFGVFMIRFGAEKPKPTKTPAQRSRAYRAAKAAKAAKEAKENPSPPVGATSSDRATVLQQAPVPVAEPDWDALAYDDQTPITAAEMDELAAIATEEEYEDEFDLINADSEGPEHFRKILAILRWRRANGL